MDLIRSIRTGRFRYIRNFMSYRPHLQANHYKDTKRITQVMRKLHASGQLDELQSRLFLPSRPTEELYDLESDPSQGVNLAGDALFDRVRTPLRAQLYDAMTAERDAGMIPEPILDEMAQAIQQSAFSASSFPGCGTASGAWSFKPSHFF